MLKHPLFQTLLDKPELLADHAGAYAELVGAEARVVQRRLAKRWMLIVLALLMLTVSLILAGVSLLVWHVVPPSETEQGLQTFVAVPAVPAVLSVLFWIFSRRFDAQLAFPLTRQQFALDRQVFRRRSAT